MNKKFTMMLAAFVAAGYTITAEAGVVKVSKPENGKSYFITRIADGDTLYISEKNVVVPSKTLSVTKSIPTASFGNDAENLWEVAVDGSGLMTLKGSKSGDGGKYINSNQFTIDAEVGAAAKFKFVSNPDGTSSFIMSNLYPLTLGETQVGFADDSNKSHLTLFAQTTALSNVKAIQVGSQFLSATLNEGKAELKLVSATEYAKNPVEWTVASGKVSVVLGTSAKVTYYITTKTPTKAAVNDVLALTQTEGEAAKIETYTQDGVTNLFVNDLYITEKLSLSNDAKDAAEIETATDLEDVKLPTATITTPAENAIANGISGDVMLYSYSDINSAKEGYLLAAGGKSTVVDDASKGDEPKAYYWNLSGSSIVAKDGTKLAVEGVTSFEVVVPAENAKYFFLYAKDKGFVKVDGSSGELSTGNADEATAFSAIAENYESTIAGNTLTSDANGAFTLKYKIGNDEVVSVLNNVTGIEVAAITGSYVAGTYFVVDAPDDLDVSSSATYTKEVLDKLTFVAISPVKSSNFAYEDEGAGYTLTTVKGEDLVAASDNPDNGEIEYNNAVFVVNNGELNEGELVVAPKGDFYVNSTTEAANGKLVSQSNSGIILAAMKGSNNSLFVATYNTVSPSKFDNDTKATLTSANVLGYSDFLGTSAKIFNIQFLSTSAFDAATAEITGTPTTAQKETYSECNKYLGIGETVSSTATMLAQGAAFVDLSLPQNQWIVTNMNKDDNTVTFTNRENTGLTFSAKLVKTDNDNEYRLAAFDPSHDVNYLYKDTDGDKHIEGILGSTETSNNLLVKLSPVTAGQNDGYVSGELSESETVKIVFTPTNSTVLSDLYLTVKDNANNTAKVVELNKEGAAQFEVIKTVRDKREAQKTTYAILKDGKPASSTEKDTLSVVTYAFKYIDGTNTYFLSVNSNDLSITKDNELKDAYQFMVKKLNNGKLALIDYNSNFTNTITPTTNAFDADLEAGEVTTSINGFDGNSIYSADVDAKAYISFEGEKSAISLPAVSQHVLFNSNGAYMAVNENKAAVLDAPSALKAEYTKEQLTFWLDTVDSKAVVPTFYITKGSKEFMFNAADSLKYYNESSASQEKAEALQMPDNELNPRAIFRSASLVASDTLSTTINGAAKKLYAEEGIEAYQYKIVLKDEAVADEYVVRSVKNNTYLYESNGALGFVGDINQAIVFNIESTEAPTSNEGVSASDVKVVAQNGSVVVMNAAGKNVVVSTILGQVVVNEVLTSDNATINVPAGIVVVAVEGESFKVNVK